MSTITRAILLLAFTTLLSVSMYGQQNVCDQISVPRAEFDARTDFAMVISKWYPEWLARSSGEKVYPGPLEPLEKSPHPLFNSRFPNSMHEDSHSTDVSNYAGPIPNGVDVQYFHVLEKKGEFSGMAPAFNFIAEDTLVTLSFGRSKTHLLLLLCWRYYKNAGCSGSSWSGLLSLVTGQ